MNSYLEFDAGKDINKITTFGSTNYYNKNHIEVAAHTTMQITNSEIMDFMGDSQGMWLGSTFNINGNLLLNNSAIVWPNGMTGFNEKKSSSVNGVPRTATQHFTFNVGSTTLMDNILFRGNAVRFKDNSDGHSQQLFVNVLLDPLPSGYLPPSN